MKKTYFEAEQTALEPDNSLENDLQQKKEFVDAEVVEEIELAPEFESHFEQTVAPKPRWWKKALVATALLFLLAVVAQSVQWLLDSWRDNQWISLAFAVVAFSVVVLGIGALISEYSRLRNLKRHLQLQQQSAVFTTAQGLEENGEQARRLCLTIAQNMQLDKQDFHLQRWQKQLNDSHNGQEVSYLFSQTVLSDTDKKARRLVSKSAGEAAIVVAISPLAVVDLFFVAWRNVALINKIAALYGIELGYFSRIRLLRMVLVNMAFAGATELIHDIGMEWLSKDLMAKLSARAAQGLGVGLLTARLGIKAIEFCRPLAFQTDEKPRLSQIHQELLTTLKASLLGKTGVEEKVR